MSSSRRATGEIHILAMLDGEAPGRRLRALPRALRYGAAGVLAGSLLVALAWLVRGGTPARDAATAERATANAAQASPRPGTSGRDDAKAPAAVHDAATATAHDAGTAIVLHADGAAPRGALIVDVAQPAPAMVPAPATPTHPATGIAAPQPRPGAARQATERATAAAAPSATTRTANRTMPPHAPSLTRTGPAPTHRKRGAAAARATPSSAAVDTDVAVISAILQHTGTRNEAADTAGTPACADKSCGAHLPSRQ